MTQEHLKKTWRFLTPLVLLLALGTGVVFAQDGDLTPDATEEQTTVPGITIQVPPESPDELLTRVGEATAEVYSFEGVAGANIRLAATPIGLTLGLVLTDAQGTLIAQGGASTPGGETVLEAILPAAGTYFVSVVPLAGSETLDVGTYNLVLTIMDSVGGVGTAEATPVPLTEVVPQPTAIPTQAPTVAPVEATIDIPTTFVTTQGMQVVLQWNSTANLDLEVRDPVGNTLYFDNPVSEFGGTFSNNVNVTCTSPVSIGAAEQATWSPGGIPTGSYEVLVYYQENCGESGPVDFTINVTVDGQALLPVSGTLLLSDVYIASFEIAPDGSSLMRSINGVRSTDQLPASAAVLIRDALPIQLGTAIVDTITNEEPYHSYAFAANANTFVTITMSATSGSLDPYLAVIDPTGNVVFFNDDAAEGVTDAALTNVLLALAGNYTVVVSRYGMVIGGTEGQYNLTVGTPPAVTPGVETTDVTTPPVTVQDVPEAVQALALPDGNIEVTLVWNSNADLQLLVRDPAGESVFDDTPTIRSGGTLGSDGNVSCTATTTSPVSYIYWPVTITPRAGAYEVDVWFQNECADTSPVSFTLYATVNEQPILSQAITANRPFLPGEHYVTSFIINEDGTVIAGEGGIIGVGTINWEAEASTSTPILGGDTVNGNISPTNKFDLYAFDGLAQDVVTVSMNAAPGSPLDTKLYLIGSSGNVVTENDDAVVGENTNSLISNFTLPENGQYIIIATHYGDRYGITSGAYTLSLDQSS